MDQSDFLPPPGPPPFLTLEQLTHLATQGWLILPATTSTETSMSHGPLAFLHSSLGKIFSLLPAFFSQSEDSKTSAYPIKQGTEFGYHHLEDEKEYVTLRCRRHEGSELEKATASVWREGAVVLQRILCDIVAGLCLDPTILDDLLDGTILMPESEKTTTSATLVRLFRYEANSGFAGVHTDLGLLTLCVGTRRGLQVLDRQLLEQGGEEKWIDVEAGEVAILVGQTIRALTNDRVRAGVHRVVPNQEDRHSVVFALRHSWNHYIDLTKFGGEARIEARKLWEALKIGVVNVNAGKERRDEQRKALNSLGGRTEEYG